MKKTLKLMAIFMAVAGVLALQSCNDDDGPGSGPVVSLNKTTDQNIPGSTISVTADVNAPNGGRDLTVYVAGVEEDVLDMGGSADFSVDYSYQIPANAIVGSKIIVSFQATDNSDYSSAVANLVITVGDPIVVLQGNLTTQTLNKGVPYLIKGQTFIPNGVTVTVQPGAIIKGDKATKGTLIVSPGGTLVANGTAAEPIVFTSSQAIGERDRGDWGGIVMLGNAFVNQSTLPAVEGISPAQVYGNNTSPATNATSNSGTLRYVRIEYAGIELSPNNETNSLTMGGIGSGTTIEYVQVSFGGDDGFEWFGGTVNAKYLVSFSTWDDDFDVDFGWSGNVQYGLAVRNPFFADQSGSNGFEIDNQGNGNATFNGDATRGCDADNSGGANTTVGCTRGIFSNITILGPRPTTPTGGSNLSGNNQNAVHYRRRNAVQIHNSFLSGFRLGIRLDDGGTWSNLAGTLTTGANGGFKNNVLTVPNGAERGATTATEAAFVTSTSVTATGNTPAFNSDGTTLRDYWTNNGNTFTLSNTVANHTALGIDAALFWDNKGRPGNTTGAPLYPSNPNFALLAGGTLSTGAVFTGLPGFFTSGTFRGAFSTTDWTDSWAEFQPDSKVY
ncbi:MAG: hypothetical protein JNL17_10770 [Cyclobacteriaceae bacterium]|nr:hypothetical protein [Cyclobacteriaceae bacterium]